MEFWKVCYAIDILEEYQNTETNLNLEDFFNLRAQEINDYKQFETFISTHRMLRAGYFLGLLVENRQYKDAEITEVFETIRDRCNGNYEQTELYQDIIENQIEKVYISSSLDNNYDTIRNEYKLYPLFTLYKILLEIGRFTGNYRISKEEFFVFVSTTGRYQEWIQTVYYILNARGNTDYQNQINLLSSTLREDNRVNRLFTSLEMIEETTDSFEIKEEHVDYIHKKIYLFETSNNIQPENYFETLRSNESLFDEVDEVDTSEDLLDQDYSEQDYINEWEQIIYYGAPGTGKSYKMNQDYPDFRRVTFHPEYSYTDFIGGLRPVQKDTISYEFISGPLTDLLLEAFNNPDEKIGLIIEEINRGNTAAIFGDTFQLLDRDDSGWSEFGIVNKEILDYFNSKGLKLDDIKFPSNLSILATMNNADQNIYVMDSAFKRRWGRKYIPIEFEDSILAEVNVAGFDISWFDFGSILNDYLSYIGVEEDKLIGQYFLTEEELVSKNKFASKLLIYLWDDVVRYNRDELFTEANNFNNLLQKFYSNGIDIFVDPLKEKFKEL